MHSHIKHYIGMTKTEKEKLWESAAFVFDTNSLLQLYRCSKSTRNAIFEAFERFRAHLWMPAQIAVEFASNRDNIIWKASNLNSIVDKFASDVSGVLLYKEKTKGSSLEKLVAYNKKWLTKYLNENDYVVDRNNDSILDKLLVLFDGKVGKSYGEDEAAIALEEGKERYRKKIPPGYKDADKCEGSRYGDYFIWRQLLDYAREEENDVVFVTSDMKEDWWRINSGGQVLGPRVELLMEFEKQANRQFHMYNLNQFLKIFSTTMEGEHSIKMQKAAKEIESLERQPYLSIFPDVETAATYQVMSDQVAEMANKWDQQQREYISLVNSINNSELMRSLNHYSEREQEIRQNLLFGYQQLLDYVAKNYTYPSALSKRFISDSEAEGDDDNMHHQPTST